MTKSKGIRARWTEEETKFVQDNPSLPIMEICTALGRSKSAVTKCRHRLGIVSDFHNPWTEDEIEILRNNNHLQNKELAKLLNRTVGQVSSQRYQKNIRMERTCEMCEATFIARASNTQICLACNPSGVRDKYSPKVRLSHYREGAAVRDIEFSLTPKEFYSFWQKPCTYCASEIETIGLDRIDASVGYTLNNVTPCCARCNVMKMADTTSGWIAQMKKILTNLGEI